MSDWGEYSLHLPAIFGNLEMVGDSRSVSAAGLDSHVGDPEAKSLPRNEALVDNLQLEQQSSRSMRVLLIEDDKTAANSIELMLSSEGFLVCTTDLGERGFHLAKLREHDIILLDLNLPDMHGSDVLKKMRTAKIGTPVLILSGIRELDSKVRALRFGADDYLTKPFQRDELVARIGAIVRRSRNKSQSVIRTGKLAVNLDAKTVEVDGSPVPLTPKEYAMVELLSVRKGSALTKEMFINHLYGGMDEPEHRIIEVFMCKLRKKMSLAGGGASYIRTDRGRGYSIHSPDAQPAASYPACS